MEATFCAAMAQSRLAQGCKADLLCQQALGVLMAERLLGLVALPVVLCAVRRRLWQLLVQRPHLQVVLLRPVPAALLLQLRRCDVSIRPSALPQAAVPTWTHTELCSCMLLHTAQDRIAANERLSTIIGALTEQLTG